MKPEIKPLFQDYLICQNRCGSETALQYIEHVEKYERCALAFGIDDILSIEDPRVAHQILIAIQKKGHHRTGKPLSDSYLFKIGSMTSAFFKFAIFYGYKTGRDPFENGIGIKKRQFAAPQYFDRDSDKMRLILAFPYTLRNKAILYLLYASAIRRSEVAKLQFSDISRENLNRGPVTVIRIRKGKGGKTREVPIDETTTKYLQVYIESLKASGYSGPWIFPGKTAAGHMLPESVYKILHLMGRRLGFRLTPHMLRHSFAAAAIEAGTPLSVVKDWMGHEDIKTTMIYTHHTRKFLIEEYHRRFATA